MIPTAKAGAPRTTWAGKKPRTETLGELRLLFTAPEASRLDDPRRHDQVGPDRKRKSTQPAVTALAVGNVDKQRDVATDGCS